MNLKEKTTIVLLAEGCYQTPEYVIRHHGRATTEWSWRLKEQDYITSVNGIFGLEAIWKLTPKGTAAYKELTSREIYAAKDRLRRIGYHFSSDPLPIF